MPKKKTKPKADVLSFEDSLDQLKSIVGELEDGNLTLGDSLEKYEHGVQHLKRCYAALESAQKKIELLVQLDEDGNLITEPFDGSATNRPGRQSTLSTGYGNPRKTVSNQAGNGDDEDEGELEDEDNFDSNSLF